MKLMCTNKYFLYINAKVMEWVKWTVLYLYSWTVSYLNGSTAYARALINSISYPFHRLYITFGYNVYCMFWVWCLNSGIHSIVYVSAIHPVCCWDSRVQFTVLIPRFSYCALCISLFFFGKRALCISQYLLQCFINKIICYRIFNSAK